MKVTMKVEKEFEVKTLRVQAGVRYWEDATLNGEDSQGGDGVPFKNGDSWNPEIDIETGVVLNWPKGTTLNTHFKVCDCGQYSLIDDNGLVVKTLSDCYVPDIACPSGTGYGDYVIMNIDENGKIENWKINLDAFIEDEG